MMSGRGLPASAASVAGAGAADGASGGYSAYDPRVTLGAGWSVNTLTGMGGKLFSGSASSTGVWSFQPDRPVDRFDLWAVTNTALGVLTVGAEDGDAVTFANHPVGWLPVQVRRVLATGTTATQIVAAFD